MMAKGRAKNTKKIAQQDFKLLIFGFLCFEVAAAASAG